jgi:hypothetical protein
MHNRIADPETPVDAAARRLHGAGWSVGEVAACGQWLVTGTNCENRIHAEADSQAAALELAVRQAETVGTRRWLPLFAGLLKGDNTQ